MWGRQRTRESVNRSAWPQPPCWAGDYACWKPAWRPPTPLHTHTPLTHLARATVGGLYYHWQITHHWHRVELSPTFRQSTDYSPFRRFQNKRKGNLQVLPFSSGGSVKASALSLDNCLGYPESRLITPLKTVVVV